jgi:hypothetical protein
MQTPKIKLIKMYVVIASTLGAINSVRAMYDPCLDISGNTAGCNVSQSKIHNSVYAALKWTFGEGIKPEALLGFRHAKTVPNGDTDGGDLSISAKFIDGFQLSKFRVKYFDGKEKVQGEIGGGYDFNKGLFTGIGVHAPYSNLGIDLLPFAKDKLETFIQIDTIKKNDKPSQQTCPNGTTLYNGECLEPSG